MKGDYVAPNRKDIRWLKEVLTRHGEGPDGLILRLVREHWNEAVTINSGKDTPYPSRSDLDHHPVFDTLAEAIISIWEAGRTEAEGYEDPKITGQGRAGCSGS